jgi:hypothetical protein
LSNDPSTAPAYGFQPVVVTGTFALIKDDPSGMLYRLHDAELVETQLK